MNKKGVCMPLVSTKEFEDTYTSPDGSIFIDFDSIDNEKDSSENEEKEEN